MSEATSQTGLGRAGEPAGEDEEGTRTGFMIIRLWREKFIRTTRLEFLTISCGTGMNVDI